MSEVLWDVAIKTDGTRVWIDEDYEGELLCPECHEVMIPVRGEVRRHHFRHRVEANCSGESAIHWTKKYEISDSLEKIGDVEVEGKIGNYFADVLFEGKWAFEVVYSNPPSEEKMNDLREFLVVFNFSDDNVWNQSEVLFGGRNLEEIVTDLGNSILNGEDVNVCNICREVKGLGSRHKADGRCFNCDFQIFINSKKYNDAKMR